ncbi:MAG: adenosylmethionine--8-amino-7-oxononanoate transaminase [Alcanivoracaceae bacterium]|nr:adenosylmethionine--8-amino-7-oxononanoate transaminase [Alcanivoracaceae bacterium]
MSLIERDKKHLWHPLTQHQLQADFLPIIKAKGALLYDENGNSYIDGIASWYTSMYGHCNDYVLAKVTEQMQQLDQIVFAGFTHQPAIKLSEALIEILPDNHQKIFFSDNGSTANEVALKMAIQYHHNRGHKRQTIVAFENAFHGDTFGAMSASGLSVYNGPFADYFIEVKRIAVPNKDNINEVLTQLKSIFADYQVAAFIYEPLVQGANAMHMYEAQYLDMILAQCKQANIISIADEVMTGFGKTGKNFASDFMQNKPDIMCLSKSLTAGFVPMAITTCTKKVYQAFLSDSVAKAFFHAHTYTANPIACAAALAGLTLLKSTEIQSNICMIIAAHQDFDKKIKQLPIYNSTVAASRQLGVIYALDLKIKMQRYGQKRSQIYDFFMRKGVCLRPLGKTIYIVPPYVIKADELKQIYAAIIDLLTSNSKA